ncbi:MAG TPA: hypothetical protein VL096_04800 [Pirellulaceae bacterium]|nr:hypothetical protein [Pirellulaceae bacterium]
MNYVTLRCPRCAAPMSVAALATAQQVQCPSCRQVVVVPAAAIAASPGPLPPHLAGTATASKATAQSSIPVLLNPIDEPPPPLVQRSGAWFELCFYGMVTLLMITAAIAGVIALQQRAKRKQPVELVANQPVENIVTIDPTETITAAPKWSNAAEESLIMNEVVVRVLSAELGEVRGRDGERNTVVSNDPNLLTIRLRITSHRERPYQYRSWYTNDFETNQGRRTAQLHDEQGQIFVPHRIRWQELQNHTPSAELLKNDPITDVVIFQLPDAASRAPSSYYRLELPAAAYGKGGTYRFQIPGDMIGR